MNSTVGASGTNSYKFTLNSASRLWFDSQTNDNSLTWNVTDLQGNVINPGNDFGSDDKAIGVVPAGSYLLRVSGPAGEKLLFQSPELLHGDSAGRRAQPSVVRLQSSRLDHALSIHVGTPGSRMLFDSLTDTNSDAGYGLDNVTLLDQYGNSLYTGNLNTSSGRLTLPSTGPYTLVVQGSLFNTGTTSYSFDVQPVNDVTTPQTLGTAVSGSIATPGQNQNYTFTLSTATRLWFDSQTDDGSLTWALMDQRVRHTTR